MILLLFVLEAGLVQQRVGLLGRLKRERERERKGGREINKHKKKKKSESKNSRKQLTKHIYTLAHDQYTTIAMSHQYYLIHKALPGGLASLKLPLLRHDAVVALQTFDLLALAGFLL